MGWHNPSVSWPELERRLAGRPARGVEPADAEAPTSRRRPPYRPKELPKQPDETVRYAELHCHSNFSFLDGASHPEELVEEAARLGLETLALTDHDGFYGVVRFAEAAAELGVRTVFGAELSLSLAEPRAGAVDPDAVHLLVLARDPEGYRRLAVAMSAAHLRGGGKGRPQYDETELAHTAGGHWLILTGCRKGRVRRALAAEGPDGAAREIDRLVEMFGRENVAVELTDDGQPLDSAANDVLAAAAVRCGLPVVATTNAHYATPDRGRLAAALAAVRARKSLDEIAGWLPAAPVRHLRSGVEMAQRFARYPGAVANAARLGAACAFDVRLIAPRLPDFPVPPGHTEMSYLRELAMRGAAEKYGPPHQRPDVYRQLDYELDVIEQLGFPGYFLVVWEIVEFCRSRGILCQGRGSAANSVVCYVLGITKADPIAFRLLFERFLSPERDGPPDIDVDIESGRREEVIQYVYSRYGRERAAQVATVITYRPRSAVRDMARALGYSPGQQDAWSKQLDRYGEIPRGSEADHDVPDDVVHLARQVLGFPRHLGIHSGGMVICDRPVAEVCPVEWARMPGRSVLQWDKDDCARIGVVKFDLLGLGMLSALRECFDLIETYHGVRLSLETIPPEDPAVYDMLCAADSVGVFQVESRAQMATLPRLQPRNFYDLVTEVAIIRPGPIQGGSVHPFIRRRRGREPVRYAHPLLRHSLERTYGVPLFQEQIMQMAIDVAGLTPAEADHLRQAMGAKRSVERMERLKAKLYAGMARNGITGAVADEIYEKLQAFAHFGFPESHAISFAFLVYASAWLKKYYPAAFCAALLNAAPLGFYSPQTVVADARRHGVVIRRPCVASSATKTILEPMDGGWAVRLGLSLVKGVSAETADRIVARRPYRDMADLARRCELSVTHLEALAAAGACECFGLDRRQALWLAGSAAETRPGQLEGFGVEATPPRLPPMTEMETTVTDLRFLGISPDVYPTAHVRDQLTEMGVVPAAQLHRVAPDSRVLVGGVVTHWQRPATARGTTFLNVEDETGMVNVICSPGVWVRYRRTARTAAALLVRGRLERADGVVNVIADRLEPLPLVIRRSARDFR
ncbi:MAG: error-prone DNA polymerase [Acidothermus cellulolyticus]|nr:error-prone DNA polymerase [Acidothermus cellulolyticus]